MNRIAPRHSMPKHSESIISLSNLIIDMKLSLQGEQRGEIITYERIKELERIVKEIEECRERTVYY